MLSGGKFEPRSDSPAVTLHFRDSISFHIMAMSGVISLWLQKELEYMPMLGLLYFSVWTKISRQRISILFLLSWWTLSLELPELEEYLPENEANPEGSTTEGETLPWYENLDPAVPDSIPDIFSKWDNKLFCLRQNELGFCHSEMSFHSRVRIVVETAEWDGPSGWTMSVPFSCPRSYILWLRIGFLGLSGHPNHQRSKQHDHCEGCWGGSTFSNTSFSMATSFLRVSTETFSA